MMKRLVKWMTIVFAFTALTAVGSVAADQSTGENAQASSECPCRTGIVDKNLASRNDTNTPAKAQPSPATVHKAK